MGREKPLHLEMVKFCKYHRGKDCFAPFTGQDWPAWKAFVYLLECYSHGGGKKALDAMLVAVSCAQHTDAVLRVFVQAIPGVMDWGDVARIWPHVAECIRTETGRDARELYAIERTEVYRGESHVQEDIKAWGWRPTAQAQGATP